MTDATHAKSTADARAPEAGFTFGRAPDGASFTNTWLATAMQNAQLWQSEMLAFMTRRIEHDRLAFAQIAQCRSPRDVAQVQQDWIAQSIAAYAEEGRRCAAIALEPAIGAAGAKVEPKPKAAA